MKKIINAVITLFFFFLMLILSILARDIHNSQIPNVTVKRLTQENFTINSTLRSGEEVTTHQKRLSIPKSIIDSGEVYVITRIYINGEERDAARLVFPQIGAENEKFYVVTSGIDRRDLVIFDSNNKLKDGDEVFIVD
jgi:hypothetical protein